MPLLVGLAELLVPVLGWLARTLVVSLVVRAFVGIGVGLVGYHFVVGPILDAVKSQMGGWPADLAQWVGILQFDKAITIICSAYVIRFAVSSLHLVKT
jgi:hypothetical protein